MQACLIMGNNRLYPLQTVYASTTQQLSERNTDKAVMMKRKETITTFLGKDTEFQGKLTFQGTIRIDGHFKGTISAKGTLIVGQDGVVESDIHVSRIIIDGEVRGKIIADRSIEIRLPGKVFGDIQAPSVTIQHSSVFEGNCKTQKIDPPGITTLKVMETVPEILSKKAV
jgi:cytoskeletal protein CcmA (bactofilin family)